MELTNEFSVAAPVQTAWATLLDVERIAPCMPGAELTSFDGEHFTGTVKVKLGPVSLTYAGKGRFVSRDEAAYRIVIEASGKDKRGTATASATVTGTLHPEGDSTRVQVVTDLLVTGAPAQFGRGLIADVAGRLIGQFATCLASKMAAAGIPDALPESVAAENDAAGEAGERAVGGDVAAGAAIVTTTAAADPAAPELIAASVPAEPAAAQPSPAAPAAGRAAPGAAAAGKGAEPIDLLAVTGTSAAVRRAMPFVLTFLAGAAVGALVVWLLR